MAATFRSSDRNGAFPDRNGAFPDTIDDSTVGACGT